MTYIVTEMDFQLRGINIVNDAIQLILAIFAEIVVTPANGSQGTLLLKLLLHCLTNNRPADFELPRKGLLGRQTCTGHQLSRTDARRQDD